MVRALLLVAALAAVALGGKWSMFGGKKTQRQVDLETQHAERFGAHKAQVGEVCAERRSNGVVDSWLPTKSCPQYSMCDMAHASADAKEARCVAGEPDAPGAANDHCSTSLVWRGQGERSNVHVRARTCVEGLKCISRYTNTDARISMSVCAVLGRHLKGGQECGLSVARGQKQFALGAACGHGLACSDGKSQKCPGKRCHHEVLRCKRMKMQKTTPLTMNFEQSVDDVLDDAGDDEDDFASLLV